MLVWPIAGSIFGQLFALARLAVLRFDEHDREQLMAAVRAVFALAFVVARPIWSAASAAGVPVQSIHVRLISAGALLYGVFLVAFSNAVAYAWVWVLCIPAALGAALILAVPISYLQACWHAARAPVAPSAAM